MKNLLVFALMILSSSIFAQSVNDECIYATDLGVITDYCSLEGEFNNSEATPSSNPVPMCFFGGADHDEWFSFVPTLGGLFVSMDSEFDFPSIAVYEGTCGSLVEIGCSSASVAKYAELALSDIKIGQRYYMRVDGRDGRTGTFQLCAKSYVPVKKPESDCKDAVVLCDKSNFVVENLNSTGEVQNELTGSCVQLGQSSEKASVWYVWTCDEPGTLEFTLTPTNVKVLDLDLDFVVYEFPGGIGDCKNRVSVRCMLSGESGGLDSSPCYGPTGLSANSSDLEEFAGCSDGSDNFVAPLNMESGKTYGMIVNNYSSAQTGFEIEWGGTGTFLGPKADLEIEALQQFECDKTVKFFDRSESLTDSIISYKWNFGAGSQPSISTGQGDQEVVYDSYGDKIASLTVESLRGCLVTKTIDFYVDPCCKDTSTLDVMADLIDIQCFGGNEGSILAQGISGSPEYQYSIDNDNYQLNPNFSNLPAGEYKVFVVDRKGCVDSVVVDVTQPTQTIADAGPDVVTDLGMEGMINAMVTSDYAIDSIIWTPAEYFTGCTNCLDPTVIAPGTTTFTLTVIDENGCPASDEVQFLVNIVRPVYPPNVFSPNDDGVNDYFNLFGGAAVDGIQSLKIYDRWGNLMYDGSPEINNRNEGWDGYYNNKLVNPGVYAWMAEIRFIDIDETGKQTVLNFSGDLTVLR